MSQPPRESLRSHLVTVGKLGSGSAYSTDDPKLNQFAAALKSSNVNFSVRRGLLRFSFHCYNDAWDVTKVLAVADGVG